MFYLSDPSDCEGDTLGGLHVLTDGVESHHLKGQSASRTGLSLRQLNVHIRTENYFL